MSFFCDTKKRLAQLMKKLRQAETENNKMDSNERAELESLIDAELKGSAKRTEAIANLINK